MRATFWWAISIAMLIWQIPCDAQTPATQPAEEAFTLTPPRVTQLKAATLLYFSDSATYGTVGGVITRRLLELRGIMKREGISLRGAPVIIYHGANLDPNAQFVVDVGMPVTEGTTAIGKTQVRSLSAKSLVAIFMGSIHQIGRPYDRMYTQLNSDGVAPTDEYREHYLYWEGDESPNNVIMIEIPLRD
jgi:effector-binding domain-containing protein